MSRLRRAFIGGTFLLLLAAASTAAAQSYTVEEGFDRPGSDYESFEQDRSSPDPDNCRAACASQPKCKSYTYVRPGAAGPNAWCRLKSATPAPIEDACCVSGVKGGQPSDRAVPSFTLDWLGWDADRVSKAPDAHTPDGAPDHHLRLTVKVPPASPLRAIDLTQADWQGLPLPDGLVWSTQNAKAQPLALESEGRRLNDAAQSADSAGITAPGPVLDLYAHDIGQWQAGNSVVAAIVLANGRRIAHAFILAPPPDRLVGRWQMLCDGGPEAFEPQTISGLFQLLRQQDDTVIGYFGRTPIHGKVDAAGAVDGIAEDATLRAVWRGKLERPTRGKPLRGSGNFVFERAPPGACAGEGMWSNRGEK